MKKLGWLLVFLAVSFNFSGQVSAAFFGADIASSYQLADDQVKSGDIISNSDKGFIRTNVEYSMSMFGVYTENASVLLRSSDSTYKPVARSGIAEVNVTTINGPIVKGNFVTSSAVPGKGQKATMSGYVLGLALADLNETNGTKETVNGKEVFTGTIPVALRVEYTEISNARTLSRLVNYVTSDLFKNVQDQGQFPMVMRYLIAGIIMLVSIAISFFTFSRSVPKAIEAVGRNPMARSTIILSLAMSIGLVIATIGLGLIASIVILRI